MKSRTHFFGITGLTITIFGLIAFALDDTLYQDRYLIGPIHLTLGLLLLVLFAFSGGLKLLREHFSRRMLRFGAGAGAYSLIFFALLIAINVISAKHEFFRFDSTADKVYSLAPMSVKVIGALKQDVLIRGFFLGEIMEPEQRELFKILKSESSRINYEIIDPEKNPQLAERYHVKRNGTVQVTSLGQTERTVEVTRDVDEESIVNAIAKLSHSSEQKVYALSGHGERNVIESSQAGYSQLKTALIGEGFEVSELVLQSGQAVPADCNLLLVLAPQKELLPAELQALHKYLTDGGHALFLVEPQLNADLKNMLRDFNIDAGNDIIVDQMVRQFGGASLGVQPVVSGYGVHPITEGFDHEIVFSTVCSVRSRSIEVIDGLATTELAKTSAHSWAETKVAAVYSDKPEAAKDKDDLPGPVSIAAASEKGQMRIVVIGDADFIANVNIDQLYNRDFVLNAVHWLTDTTERISVRPPRKAGAHRAISVSEFSAIFIIAGILLPEIICILGVGIWWSRRM